MSDHPIQITEQPTFIERRNFPMNPGSLWREISKELPKDRGFSGPRWPVNELNRWPRLVRRLAQNCHLREPIRHDASLFTEVIVLP
jgi:hypothetical protein